MVELKIGSILAGIAVAWGIFKKIGRIINDSIAVVIKFSQDPDIKELIQKAEEAAKDGIINKAERKDMAMRLINAVLKAKNIQLNALQRFILNKVVDKIAEALPDFKLKGMN
jgi:hypothetical protein